MSHPWKVSLKDDAPLLISVELPCFVKSQDRALDMIGGSEHVQRTLSVDDGAPLECRLPGDNILRPNLVSSVQCKRSVVLKIKRKKVIKNGKVVSSTITSFDIVGLVKKTVVFTNPADFQFLPTFNSSSSYSPTSSSSASTKGHVPLEIVPQSISRADLQKRQQFLNFLHVSKRMKRSAGGSAKKDKASSTGNMEGGSDSDGNEKDDDTQRKEAGDDDDKSIATTTRRRNPDAGHTQILKFGESIPGIHPLGKYPPRWIAKRDKTGEVFRGIQFIDRLNLLFEKIPVLKRSQIVDMLDLGPRQHLLKECLPYAAYTYSNGPFASLWIRYGYDATAHPSSRIYQNLNCRFPPQYLIKLSDSLADYIGRESVHRKMVDLNKLVIVDAPEKFEHRFINTGAFARLPMSLFGYICKHQIAFQVHTLADKRLFAFIQQLPITNMCTEQTGWFTEDAVVVFRNFICEVMEQRVQSFLQSTVVFAPRPPPPVIARSEDQALVAVRVQKALDDFQVFEHVDDAWILAQDTYTPTFSLASPVALSTTASSSSSSAEENVPSTSTSSSSLVIELEETVTRVMFFWLTKYRLAATEKSEMVEKMLLPALSRRSFSTGGSSSSDGSNLISTAGTTSSGGSEWSSSKRKSGRQTELEDKVRDQSAIWSATYTMQATPAPPPTSSATASTLGPLFSAASQPPMAPPTLTTSTSASSKRNVRFAPNVAASTSSSSSMAAPAPALPTAETSMANMQFTLNSDVLAKTMGFSMLGDDSDSEDD